MNYTPVKCPNCGSGAIVPAEGQRIYCKSCDQYSERTKAEPKPASVPTKVRLEPEDPRDAKSALWAYYAILFLFCFVLVALAQATH